MAVCFSKGDVRTKWVKLIVTLIAQQLKRIGREAALQGVQTLDLSGLKKKWINPHELVQGSISGLTRVQPGKGEGQHSPTEDSPPKPSSCRGGQEVLTGGPKGVSVPE